ncbi:MAG: L,D-transpeptidase [Patescibacteria group bacterium]
MKKFILFLLILAFPCVTFALDERPPEAKVYNRKFDLKKSFFPFENMNQNGGSIAVGDLGKDKKAEIIIGSGPGEEPWVYVFTSNGKLKYKFLAYDQNFKMGVNVAVGNVRGKKAGKKNMRNEIITAPMIDGGPQVRVFNKKGDVLYNGTFFAFPENFKGGVNIAACDTNGNGKDEIIASAGPGGETHARVFDSRGNYLGLDFRPFSSSIKGGATVSCANVDGGSEDELVFGVQSFGTPWVKVYKTNAEKIILGDFLAYPHHFKGGVQVASGDMDKDGVDEIITAPNWDGAPQVRVFEGHGEVVVNSEIIYESDFKGGVRLAAGKLTTKLTKKQRKNGKIRGARLVTLPSKRHIEGRSDLFKYIDVNLSEQRLRAYRNGKKDHDFLVSTGKGGEFETPTGDFTIQAKIASMTMEHEYGPDDPNNYRLENVPHVMSIYGDITIHGAYWHNNWGHVMSHGCINEPLDRAAELYNWSNIGDPVLVHY